MFGMCWSVASRERKTLLAGIEELVNQIVFNPAVARKQIGNEKLGEFRLCANGREHGALRDGSDQAVFHRVAGDGPQLHPFKTPFAEELPFAENPDDGFLAVLGQNRDLDLALLDEEDRVGGLTLAEDLLVFGISLDGLARAGLGQKKQGVERVVDLR